jgi:hypothetical protein
MKRTYAMQQLDQMVPQPEGYHREDSSALKRRASISRGSTESHPSNFSVHKMNSDSAETFAFCSIPLCYSTSQSQSLYRSHDELIMRLNCMKLLENTDRGSPTTIAEHPIETRQVRQLSCGPTCPKSTSITVFSAVIDQRRRASLENASMVSRHKSYEHISRAQLAHWSTAFVTTDTL